MMMQNESRLQPRTAVIIGASGGLGGALIGALAAGTNYDVVIAVSRSPKPVDTPATIWFQANVSEPAELDGLVAEIEANYFSVNLLINCIGTLHGGQGKKMPEKALKQLNERDFQRMMTVNAFLPLAVLNSFAKLLRQKNVDDRSASVAVVLSAMVGSTTDNQLGGWYSYRMSKAALNMGLRNVAIEWGRLKGSPTVVALHPGTTLTALSQPFVARHNHRTPKDSAVHILQVIGGLDKEDSGKFFNWDGRVLAF